MNPASVSHSHLLLQYLLALEMVSPASKNQPKAPLTAALIASGQEEHELKPR